MKTGVVVVMVALTALGPACRTGDTERVEPSPEPQSPERTTTTGDTGTAERQDSNGCVKPGDAGGRQVARLERVPAGPVALRAAVYPRPEYPAELWSQWGQGLVVGDRFVSGLGDHCGANGNSFVYVLDDEGVLRSTADVLSLVEHRVGAWGYGKLHAQMVPGPGGAVYTTTYWGSRRGLAYGDGYEGDLLLRIDPATGKVENLGVPVPGHGIPSLAAWPEEGLLYGEAVDGSQEKEDRGLFFVYDLAAEKVVFQMDKGTTPGFRSVLVDGTGRAYFSTGSHTLHVYDPGTGKATRFAGRLPGEWLRAASRPAPDGTVYGVTREPDALFALSPAGQVRDLGPVRGYTASIALAHDGILYYVPGAHGNSWKQGTPVVAVDPETGRDRVVVKLNDTVGKALGLRLGGSYSVVADPSSDRLLIGLNAGPPGTEESFGEIVLVEVQL